MSKMPLLAALIQSSSSRAMARLDLNRMIVVQLHWMPVEYRYSSWIIDFSEDSIISNTFEDINILATRGDKIWRPLEDFRLINGEHHKPKIEQYARHAIDKHNIDDAETKNILSSKMHDILPYFDNNNIAIEEATFPKSEPRMIHVKLDKEPWQALNIDTMQWELWETA